jgi:hypothetical protein
MSNNCCEKIICCEKLVRCCEPKCCEPKCCEPKCCETRIEPCYKSCCDPCNPCNLCCADPCCPEMTDCLAKQIECIWRKAFCDATIIPKLGVPSCACSVMTLTHTLGNCAPCVSINGLKSKSMLTKNAFYSTEVSCGKWINLYQIVLPNIPGKCGCKSSGEIYTEALTKLGISLGGDSYTWKGSCPNMLAINSQAIGMDPCEFSKKQIAAIKAVLNYFNNCC